MYQVIDKAKPYIHLEYDSDSEELGLNWSNIHGQKLSIHDEMRKLNLLVNEKKKNKKVAQRAQTTQFTPNTSSSSQIVQPSYQSGKLTPSEIAKIKTNLKSDNNKDSGNSSSGVHSETNSYSGIHSDSNSLSDQIEPSIKTEPIKKPVSRYDLYKPKRRACSGSRVPEHRPITKSKTANIKSLITKFDDDKRRYSTNSDDSRENYDFPKKKVTNRRSKSLEGSRKLEDLEKEERRLREYQKELDRRTKKIAEIHERLKKRQKDIIKQESEIYTLSKDLKRRDRDKHKSLSIYEEAHQIKHKRKERRRRSRSSSKTRTRDKPTGYKKSTKSHDSSISKDSGKHSLSDQKERERELRAIEKQQRSRRRAKEESLLEQKKERRRRDHKDDYKNGNKRRDLDKNDDTRRRRRDIQKNVDEENLKRRHMTHV